MGGEQRLNIPKLTSLAVFINLYLYGQQHRSGVWQRGLDRWCDRVCLLRYHTERSRDSVSHGHYIPWISLATRNYFLFLFT